MAYVGTKGYYVEKLKQHGIRQLEGKPLEQFKTHVLRNLFYKEVKGIKGITVDTN